MHNNRAKLPLVDEWYCNTTHYGGQKITIHPLVIYIYIPLRGPKQQKILNLTNATIIILWEIPTMLNVHLSQLSILAVKYPTITS